MRLEAERKSLDLYALDCWQSDKMQLPADHEIFEHAIRNSGSWVDGGIIGVNGWSVIRFHANGSYVLLSWCSKLGAVPVSFVLTARI